MCSTSIKVMYTCTPRLLINYQAKYRRLIGFGFATSICKIAVLKGCEQEAAKLLRAKAKFSTGFNLIKDVAVEVEESVTSLIQ